MRAPAPFDRPDLSPPAAKWPVLVVHGGADETLPLSMGREVARAPRARLVEVPGAGHLELLADRRSLSAVREAVLGR